MTEYASPEDQVKEIELTDQPNNMVRLSVFIDYYNDNHHIQFPKLSSRRHVAQMLRQLADRIRRGGN
jgi:hypothetical protein